MSRYAILTCAESVYPPGASIRTQFSNQPLSVSVIWQDLELDVALLHSPYPIIEDDDDAADDPWFTPLREGNPSRADIIGFTQWPGERRPRVITLSGAVRLQTLSQGRKIARFESDPNELGGRISLPGAPIWIEGRIAGIVSRGNVAGQDLVGASTNELLATEPIRTTISSRIWYDNAGRLPQAGDVSSFAPKSEERTSIKDDQGSADIEQVLEEAIEAGDTSPLRDLARLALADGNTEQAKNLLEQAVTIGDPIALLELARILIDQGNSELAISLLQRAADNGDASASRELLNLLARQTEGNQHRTDDNDSEGFAGRTGAGNGQEALGSAAATDEPLGDEQVRQLAGTSSDTVPVPGHGRVRAADMLGTEADVEMLAAVLATRDTPLPLSVGLFGKWGSGKSFFMALMQERIEELAAESAAGTEDGAVFCASVRQVRFNAWHYVDTDLWASLAATLFDELALPNEEPGAPEAADLQGARRGAQAARDQRVVIERDLETQERRAASLTSLVTTSVAAAVDALRADPTILENIKQASKGVEVSREDVDLVIEALGRSRSLVLRVRDVLTLFRQELSHGRRTLTVSLLVVFTMLALVFTVSLNTSILVKFASMITAVVVGLLPALYGAIKVLNIVRSARLKREFSLNKKREQLEIARTKERQADALVTQIESELDPGERLQAFVRERSTSNDYRRHLGTISRLRHDFEQLVEILAMENRADAPLKPGRVERIFLYIDDLDRCSSEIVVQVLQAVHLLLAFPLFVVIVGMDTKWVHQALRTEYGNLLEDPIDYLEKIFQVPFALAPLDQSSYSSLVASLARPLTDPTPSTLSQGQDQRALPLASSYNSSEAKLDTDRSGLPAAESGVSSTEVGRRDTTSDDTTNNALTPSPTVLRISGYESAFLSAVGPLVVTPRGVKRLFNVYRMIRVSLTPAERQRFESSSGSEYRAVVVLLAIMIAQPHRAASLFEKIRVSSPDDDIWPMLSAFDLGSPAIEELQLASNMAKVEVYQRWVERIARFSFVVDATPREETTPR